MSEQKEDVDKKLKEKDILKIFIPARYAYYKKVGGVWEQILYNEETGEEK